MAQFDVYRNPSKKTSKVYPLLVDVQNSVIDQLATRLTVPLIKRSTKSSLYMKKLTPEIEYQGETYLFLAQQLSAIPEEVLRDRIGSLEQHRDLLIDAIDFAITGI
ncbi:MAG TPA: plasmid maintenance protein CcdB [Alteromonas sp.]|nr:plasmid maintenance protein CcdB [Alteromonas sp.]HCL11188.1 plasmid maintenance protein CcdB [Alteromonas sp.]HCV18636.1 plasmid maintenance protein CcdB [Alteromonas sp.]|tara:strand:+ start:31 stop:348 length:318 start_codon:yes stop_codon:yes gene_type:complete